MKSKKSPLHPFIPPPPFEMSTRIEKISIIWPCRNICLHYKCILSKFMAAIHNVTISKQHHLWASAYYKHPARHPIKYLIIEFSELRLKQIFAASVQGRRVQWFKDQRCWMDVFIQFSFNRLLERVTATCQWLWPSWPLFNWLQDLSHCVAEFVKEK